MGLDYLINISYVDNVEVFKTCLDYWNYFVPDVYARWDLGWQLGLQGSSVCVWCLWCVPSTISLSAGAFSVCLSIPRLYSRQCTGKTNA